MFKNRRIGLLAKMTLLCVVLSMLLSISAIAGTVQLSHYSMDDAFSNAGYPSEKAVKKVAKKVKIGLTTVVLPNKEELFCARGYLKFKAPKTKTYTFTISDLKDPNVLSLGSSSGDLMIEEPVNAKIKYGKKTVKKKILIEKKIKTQGGKAANLYIGTEEIAAENPAENKLLSRYGKLKLKKGQIVYLRFSFEPSSTVKLKIS